MSTSREIRFSLPTKYADVFDRVCAEHSLNQRDMLIWLLSPHEHRQYHKDNTNPVAIQAAQSVMHTPTAKPAADDATEKLKYWRRDEPLTPDEMEKFKELNTRSIRGGNMAGVERTELYAYVDRYQKHHA